MKKPTPPPGPGGRRPRTTASGPARPPERPSGTKAPRGPARVRAPVAPDAGADGPAPRRHAASSEQHVHGVRACAALFAHRPGDVIRVYLSANRKPTFKSLLEHCVAHRLGFQVVDDESLRKLSGGLHHEGIVILAREPARLGAGDLLARVAAKEVVGPILWLDGVQNPHNLGSILRSAAHFGCGAVAGEAAGLPALAAATLRVAEGGAEYVPLFAVEDAAAVLRELRKASWRIVATTSRAGTPLAASGLSRGDILVLGSEGEGVSPRITRIADLQVRIPGSGAVQSLNVAVACGIVLAEACRGDLPTAAHGASRAP